MTHSDAVNEAGEVETASGSDGELISRLRLIEQQPLEDRAASYVALHDGLSQTIDTSGRSESSRPHD